MLTEAFDFLQNQTLQSLLAMFWIIWFVELPRYMFGAVAATWALFKGRHIVINSTTTPAISVVVPGHNDASSLHKTVLSLREQVGVHLQIIAVNDGSTDDTDDTCRELERQGLIDTYIHIRSRGGKAAAVNTALSLAHHPYFLVTDSDTTFDRDALRIACSYMEDPQVAAVAGNLRVRNVRESLATRVQQINYLYSILLGRLAKDMMGFYYVASGAFGLYRTATARSIGGWDFGPGEDGDIATRLRLSGWRVRFAPLAIAMTDAPVSFVRLARQRLRWDRSMIRLRWRKSRRFVINPRSRLFNPMLALSFLDIYFFQGILPFLFILYVIHLVTIYGTFGLVLIGAVHLIYLIISCVKFALALSLTTRLREDIRLFPYVPLYTFINIYLLRFVKMFATANELIMRRSYDDAYVPKKVRDQIVRY